ncbi:Fic family protein [Candidatus Parcubacteria bacterium]|nr:Fic family protein [Candidatus Parcubacteria bacterium]
MNITYRQNLILDFIREKKGAGNKEIKKYLDEKIGDLNRATIVRDIDILLNFDLIKKEGMGRNVIYKLKKNNLIDRYINPQEYFKTDADERDVYENFNFDIFNILPDNLFSKKEIINLEKLNNNYKRRISDLSPVIMKKEIERLTIELSWKSSKIEGNTYSLLDTEMLIKENIKARGHTEQEVIMILNHKKALEYILHKKNIFKNINVSKIENVHSLVVGDLNIKQNIRERLVRIIGTKYRPLDNQFQIREALENMNNFINQKKVHPLIKSMMAVLLISYIQPFEDGNKRTARLIGNALLSAYDYCPLSYRSVDVVEYKKATILFYEQNNISYFKQLFIEQFEFAVENYFG